jgi:hypothetical protein
MNERKLKVGAVIRRVWSIYVDQAPVLMPVAAVVFVFTGIFSYLLLQAGSAGLSFLGLLIGLIATTLFTGMVVELVSDVQDGRRDATPSQLLRAVTPVLGTLIAVALAVGVLTLIGFLLVIPGLIALTVWAVAAPVVVLERPEGLRAMRRSRELVAGNGWPVFGVILVLGVAVAVVAAAIEIAAESAGTGAGIVTRVVVGVLTAPFSALGAAVLYFELLRVRQEAAPEIHVPEAPAASPDPFGSE